MGDVPGQTRTKATHRRVRPPEHSARPTPTGPRLVRPMLLLSACLAASGSLAACGHGPSDATTLLRGAAGVTVVSAAGVPHPGVDGERLTVGETVRTSGTDSALVTGRRVTTLGRSTTVGIADRSRYLLDAGTVVVDHHHGPGIRVDAGPVSVEDLGHTAVRIERGFAVRVAVFDGGSATVSASERSTAVPALHEMDVPGASLPAASTPLALRDDTLDTIAAAALVRADGTLNGRAATLDRTGAAVVPAALVRALPTAPPSTALSERVLPVAIARADRGTPLAGAYARATELRTDGGSWAVVAALMDAKVDAVQQQLDQLLAGASGVLGGLPATARQDAGAVAVAALLSAAAPAGTTPASVAPGTGATSAPPRGGVSAPPPVPSPVPTPSPIPPPLVQTLITTITGLLPHGGASAPPAPTTPRPAPTPTPSGGLLGGVLGSLLGAG